MTALINEANAHTSRNGYAIAKNGGKACLVYFRCVKGCQAKSYTKPEAHESKRRKTSIQMTVCSFRLSARVLESGKVLLEWSYPKDKAAVDLPQDYYSSHNHEFMTKAASGHDRSKRLQDYKEQVITLANNGIRPHQILGVIGGHELGFIAKDIYNLIQAHRLAELNDRSPLQTLYEDYLIPSCDNDGLSTSSIPETLQDICPYWLSSPRRASI